MLYLLSRRNYWMGSEFKANHDHCNVPQRENSGLGCWGSSQCKANSNNAIRPEPKKALNEIGFVWSQFDIAWEQRFAKLKEFKTKHNNCNVPQGQNSGLSWWVQAQRAANSNKTICPERKKALDDIGFKWRN
eukprot:CCRYP_002623-RA/>CCRYP_002623-RA protein AED:0.44 eAED:0.50 QI:0/0/0/1/0/0/2/0/131